MDAKDDETRIFVTRNHVDLTGDVSSYGDGQDALLNFSDPPDGMTVTIRDERIDSRARMSVRHFESLIEGRSGAVRLGPCPDCGAIGVYEGGAVVRAGEHDEDMCTVLRVMGS